PSTSYPPPPIVLPHTWASVAMLKAATPSTYILAPQSETPPLGTPPLLHIPLPTSLPPLLLPSTSHKADVLEVTLPPRKRLCISLDHEIRRDPEREVGYGSTDSWDEMLVGMSGVPVTDETELDDRLLMGGQLNILRRDRRAHARTARLMEREARLSCEAWMQSMDAIDTARADVMSLRTTLGTDSAKDTTDTDVSIAETKMAPKRTTRSTPATTTTTTTTPVTNAQLKTLIDQGIADALAARDADRI
nr:hypothetical protein [Tanacetum cinerariifolium]GFA17117.1 hypothetical protein [Tanacetum cinerariifolium]